MLKTTVISLLLIGVTRAETISFKNVTLEWKTSTDRNTTTIPSSANLRDNIPKLQTEISVVLSGLVPVLYPKSVSGVPTLKSLTVSNVGLREIKPGAIENLPLLAHLILNRNELKVIERGTFTNLNLTSVNLGDNEISKLELGAFKNLKIHHLTLSNNKISEIRNGTFENVSLQSLNLYGNGLRKIDGPITNLTNLVLSNNNLTEIDLHFPDLKYLDLSFNSIQVLKPGDLKNLPALDTLDLTANTLHHVPEGVFSQSKLVTLKLNYNQIAKIEPKSFDDMSQLSVLHIDHNNLTQWDDKWLSNSPKLAYIFAGFNRIGALPGQAFRNYPQMYSIDLQGNLIKEVSRESFAGLEKVVNFSLRDNLIVDLDPEWLANATVGSVDLSGNKLGCVEGNLEEAFRRVDFVHLEGNPWREDCVEKIKTFLSQWPKIKRIVSSVSQQPI
ncbi:leucine-rich repeat-containing protein 15 [Tribolium castaneum]|uniref:Insulin-like growth factor-binding protein complex acid labile subunit n=1 Tax=Tribolium castaneum TaxID=7070 RepID=D6WJH4_TRICA|nr:PREDICTED: toll-like receptor 3 [Tribolium castaneum]EFA03898.1 Insulin-like growth factor-binding protein complex acid labile subunit [Tribolium castaneum]|eukprot:XP_008193067.1 PREDICTED: toll-like receptor 3 [Tribolium castaneum]